jgi:uncharacterized protein
MYKNINNIEFDLTSKCNLSCKYCYLGKRDSKSIPLKAIKLFFDKFFDSLHSEKELLVSFWGGEPLIEFSKIKVIVQNFEKRKAIFKSINYRIITNGTLISDKIAAFCNKHHISLQITIDGFKDYHDSVRHYENGTGSFDAIMKNLQKLNSYNIKYYIRVTLTSSAGLPSNIIRWLKDNDIKNVSFGILTPTEKYRDTDFNKEKADELAHDYIEYFKEHLFDEFEYSNISSLLTLITNQTPHRNCGVGINKICIRYDGKVFPCHRYSNTDELSIGSIFSGFDIMLLYPHKYELLEENIACINCDIKYLCGGACYYEIQNNKNLNWINEYECRYRISLIKALLKHLCHLYLYDKVSFNLLLKKFNVMCDTKQYTSSNMHDIKSFVFCRAAGSGVIDLNDSGVIYRHDNFENKYITNSVGMAIWDLLDGCRTAKEIAEEIAGACKFPLCDIESDIYEQLSLLYSYKLVERKSFERLDV